MLSCLLPRPSLTKFCVYVYYLHTRFPSNNGKVPGWSGSALNQISFGHDATMRSPVTGKWLNGRGFLPTAHCFSRKRGDMVRPSGKPTRWTATHAQWHICWISSVATCTCIVGTRLIWRKQWLPSHCRYSETMSHITRFSLSCLRCHVLMSSRVSKMHCLGWSSAETEWHGRERLLPNPYPLTNHDQILSSVTADADEQLFGCNRTWQECDTTVSQHSFGHLPLSWRPRECVRAGKLEHGFPTGRRIRYWGAGVGRERYLCWRQPCKHHVRVPAVYFSVRT